MSNDNEGRTFSDYVELGNGCGTFVIVLLLMAIILLGTPVALHRGLELDRLSDQLDNGQRQYVHATPTPVTTEHMSRGEMMREEAKRGREEINRQFWAGR